WYFGWYPRYKAKKGFNVDTSRYELQPDLTQSIDVTTIKSTGELFADAFIFYRNHFGRIVLAAILASIFFSGIILATHDAENFWELFSFNNALGNLGQFFAHPDIVLLPIIAILTFSGLTLFLNQLLLQKAEPVTEEGSRWSGLLLFLKTVTPVTLMYLLIRIGEGYTGFFVLLLFPVVLLWLFVMMKNDEWYLKGLSQSFYLMGAAYFKLISIAFIMLLISALFYSLLDTSLTYFFIDIVSWNLPFKGIAAKNVLYFVMLFTSLTVLFLLYPLFVLGINLYAFSQTEVKEAKYLKAQIREIGLQKELRGMVME
ncbi:MAG: hypothetical protein AAGJ18_30645, partial [Bacteroidota bacterium]